MVAELVGHSTALGLVKRRDCRDIDGGAGPADYAADHAARDPDDAEPDPAADPAAARSCCHYAIGTKGGPSPEVLHEARQVRRCEEKWREWSYDFRMATATQNATVFEILSLSFRFRFSFFVFGVWVIGVGFWGFGVCGFWGFGGVLGFLGFFGFWVLGFWDFWVLGFVFVLFLSFLFFV